MKLIITILLLTIGAFAQNTTYKDGTDCECDSISGKYLGAYVTEIAYTNNQIIREKRYNHDIITVDYKYNIVGDIVESVRRDFVTGYIIGHMLYGNDTTWYDNGQIRSISENEYNVKNYKCDTWKAVKFTYYYENGKVKNQRSDLSSKCIQTEKSFYDNGKLAGTTTYKDGKLVGYKKCTDGRFGNENLDCLK